MQVFPLPDTPSFSPNRRDTPQVVMMLVGGGMRVALATTHLPLREVADAITAPLLENILRIMQRDLQQPLRHRTAAHPGCRSQSACW